MTRQRSNKKVTDFSLTKKAMLKIPVFSFNKFPNVNKLGPEMKSTGENSFIMMEDSLRKYMEASLYLRNNGRFRTLLIILTFTTHSDLLVGFCAFLA